MMGKGYKAVIKNNIQTFSYFKHKANVPRSDPVLTGWERGPSSILVYTEVKTKMELAKESLLQPRLHENNVFRLMNTLLLLERSLQIKNWLGMMYRKAKKGTVSKSEKGWTLGLVKFTKYENKHIFKPVFQ